MRIITTLYYFCIILLFNVNLKSEERIPIELLNKIKKLDININSLPEGGKMSSTLEFVFNLYEIKHDIILEESFMNNVKFKGEVRAFFIEIITINPLILIEYNNDLVKIRTLKSIKYLEYSDYVNHNFFNDYSMYSKGDEKVELLCIFNKNFNNEKNLFFILKENQGQNGYCLRGLELMVLDKKIMLSDSGIGTILPYKTTNKQKISLFQITDLNLILSIEEKYKDKITYGPVLITDLKITDLFIK